MTTSLKDLLKKDDVKKRFHELLGKRSSGFITSILQAARDNNMLSKADPLTIINAAATAATLNLPINPNLGFAYIIPYNTRYKDENGRDAWKVVAQFQMGYKGFVQLAQRSGQFKTLNVTDVRASEIKNINRMTGEYDIVWLDDEARNESPIVGYMAYFSLINGFEKSLFMKISDLEAHGKKYSKNYGGQWSSNFDSMASKTVVKLLLSKYAPLTIDMQKAHLADQSVQTEEGEYEYVDNEPVVIDQAAKDADTEHERIVKAIEAATESSIMVLERDLESEDRLTQDYIELIEKKKTSLMTPGQLALQTA